MHFLHINLTPSKSIEHSLQTKLLHLMQIPSLMFSLQRLQSASTQT